MKDKPKRAAREVYVPPGAWGPWDSKQQERYAFNACDRLAASDDPVCHRDKWGYVKSLLGRLWPLLVYKNVKDGLRIVFSKHRGGLMIWSAGPRKEVYENPVARRAAERMRRRG